jgi:hypothetical protein
MTTFKSFVRLTGVAPSRDDFLSDWIATWKFNPLTNDIKKFIFNCRFNLLPLNNRLNSYINDIDPRCTFCRLRDANTTARDSFGHCFFSCPVTKNLLTEFFTSMSKPLTDNDDFKNFFWYGICDDDMYRTNKVMTTVYNIVFDITRYVIYKWRLRNIIPTYNEFINHVQFILHNLCNASKKFKNFLLNTPPLSFLVPALG